MSDPLRISSAVTSIPPCRYDSADSVKPTIPWRFSLILLLDFYLVTTMSEAIDQADLDVCDSMQREEWEVLEVCSTYQFNHRKVAEGTNLSRYIQSVSVATCRVGA